MRWRSGVAAEERGYEGDRGTEGDQESGREDLKETTRKKVPDGWRLSSTP